MEHQKPSSDERASEKLLERMQAHKAGEGAEESFESMKLCSDLICYVFEHMAGSCKFHEPAMPIHDEFAGECLFNGREKIKGCNQSNCPLLKG